MVSAVLVDFDGTTCPTDVGDEVCARFARVGWRDLDDEADAGHITLRRAIAAQTAMLAAPPAEMLEYVLARFAVDPTFPAFVRWASGAGIEVKVVSDGLGFYVRSMLSAAGLHDLPVLANHVRVTEDGLQLVHPHAHPRCEGCGVCKAQAVLDVRMATGPVAFVGDGKTDRYAALFADVIFAKHRLAELCLSRGRPFLPWRNFDDISAALVTGLVDAGPARPLESVSACPGWEPSESVEEGGCAQ
jgi:2-hydroxy-3-keto-5-methylthiopentenyl-1-phosphate phosphatase